MQLVALEWIPLSMLFLLMLLTQPTVRVGLATALALLLVIPSDYCYFLHTILAAGFAVAWTAVRRRAPWLF